MVLDPSRPEVSYLLGLLHTDGWHSGDVEHKGKVGIELHERDVDILHELREVIPCTTTLTSRRRSTNFADDYVSVTLQFFDRTVRSSLAELGMPPGRKVSTVGPPQHVGLVHRDYLRGVLDGDGSVGFTATGTPFVSLVTASEPMVRFVEEQIRFVCGVERNTRRNVRDAVFNVMVTNRAAVALAEHCWPDGVWPALARKATSARRVAVWAPPAHKVGRYGVAKKPWCGEQDAIVLALPPSDAARLLDRTLKSVSVRRWRLLNGLVAAEAPPRTASE